MTRAAKALLHTTVLTALILVLSLCSQCSNGAPRPRLSEPAERGRTAFATYCFPCHNPSDPHQSGQIGPAVARSSKELLEAKVLTGKYPPGYQPKQAGAQMVALPHVKAHLDDIAVFLAEVPPAR